MLRKNIACLLFFMSAATVFAQTTGCRVMDPELQGVYQGACRDGLAEGSGVARGQASYVGDFKAGKKHGRGIKQWPNGDHFIGDFVADLRQGSGIYTWGAASPFAGQRYTGEYQGDKRHGKGVYEWPNGDRYEGGWANDQVTGYATPMQTLQYYHRQALAKAVSKAGTKVCRDIPLGLAGKEVQTGAVRILQPDGQLEVEIMSGESSGKVLKQDIAVWYPCQ